MPAPGPRAIGLRLGMDRTDIFTTAAREHSDPKAYERLERNDDTTYRTYQILAGVHLSCAQEVASSTPFLLHWAQLALRSCT